MHRARDEENLHEKTGNHGPAKAKAVAGNITFPPFMGARGLVPWRGVGQRPTISWRKHEAGGGAAPHKPSFSSSTACLKTCCLRLPPTNALSGRGGDTVLRMILQHLRGREGLLILDEAQHLLLPR